MGGGKVGNNFWRRSALRFGSLKIGAEIPHEIPLYNCNHYCANEHAKKGNPSCPFDLNRGFDDLLYAADNGQTRKKPRQRGRG